MEGYVVVLGSLLPLAAWSGWYLCKREILSKRSGDVRKLITKDYFRGLNFLLDDRPDEAIEVFRKVIEIDSETVETHLALGNLFRRRGEVDRAIQIHQNLVARRDLDHETRSLALLELGLDYMRSGLLDRAEGLFLELLEMGSHQHEAVNRLMDIYQQEQDWEKALEFAFVQQRIAKSDNRVQRAHFLCEQAELFIQSDRIENARKKLILAEKADPNCPRTSLMQARLAIKESAFSKAISYLQQIENQDVSFLPEAVNMLVYCHKELGKEVELTAYLVYLTSLNLGTGPIIVLCEQLWKMGKIAEARDRLLVELRRTPSVRGIELLLLLSNPAEGELLLQQVKEFARQIPEDRIDYVCGSCGFQGRTLHWQCPGCKLWNSVKAV